MTEKITILRKYNFWDKPVEKPGFLRLSYLTKIEQYLHNKLVKVFSGQRRTGKSYVMRQLIYRLHKNGVPPQNILYINMEFTDFDFVESYVELQNLIELYLSEIQPKGKIYLFLDEIQTVKSWEKLINSLAQDYTREYELFITGSNSELLSGELSSYLSGRYVEFQILPYSYSEYLSFQKLKNIKQHFIEYMNFGGLPELFNLKTEETRRHYVSAIKNTILLRDIIQRYNIKDANLLESLFGYLVNNASNLISIPGIVKYYKSRNKITAYETVANYINYLNQSFLVHQAEKYHIAGKEILSGNYKFYLNDLAYKNFLYPGFSYGIGYKLENLIYLQLLKKGYDVYIGQMRNKEVDFVAIKAGKPVYIQVSYLMADEATAEREYQSLEAIKDSYPKLVVSMDDVLFDERNGIQHIQAWNFMNFETII